MVLVLIIMRDSLYTSNPNKDPYRFINKYILLIISDTNVQTGPEFIQFSCQARSASILSLTLPLPIPRQIIQ